MQHTKFQCGQMSKESLQGHDKKGAPLYQSFYLVVDQIWHTRSQTLKPSLCRCLHCTNYRQRNALRNPTQLPTRSSSVIIFWAQAMPHWRCIARCAPCTDAVRPLVQMVGALADSCNLASWKALVGLAGNESGVDYEPGMSWTWSHIVLNLQVIML